jgi:LuxR family maltose regulon positive regulatory protein
VSVRRGEKDPQHFWLSLLEAERAVSTPNGPLDSLAPAPEFDASMVVDKMLQQLTQGDQPLVLVIDDLNELESREAMEQLEQLLLRLPPWVRVVLASRHDPRLRLHQLRLEGELTEVRSADLAFSADEAAELLKRAGVQLRESDVALLQERTEGWAAGLRLAAISLTGHTEPERFVAEFSGSERTVAEYLLAEMLERQPADVRHLLLRTSIVDRINGALGDVLTGTTGTEQTFHALEDANAFVMSLDPERSWFRYHYLFGDLLRLELRRTAPDEVPELHRRAAEWFATHGHVVEAIRHAQAAQAWAYAARLLVDNALNLTLDGQAAVVHDLLGRFPPAALQADPELTVVLAADQVEHGSLDDAAAYLALAEVHLNRAPPERRARLDVARAVVKLLLARRRGDFSDVLEQVGSLAQPNAVRSHAAVALSSELRAVALMNLGIVEMWFGMAEAEKHLEEAVRLARRTGRPYLEVGCLAHLGFAANVDSFAKARKRCLEAITLAESHGWGESHVIAPALATLGGTLLWSGVYDEAEHVLERAEKALRSDIEPATSLLWHLTQGALHAARGEWDRALERFRSAEEMQTLLVSAHALAVHVRANVIVTQVRLGRLDAASESVAAIEDEPEPWAEMLIALALVRHAQGRPQDAIDALAPVLDGSAPVIRELPVMHEFTAVQAQMVAACAWMELGDGRASEAAVEQALALAEPERLVLPFALAPGRELLERHPRHASAHAALLTTILDILHRGSAVPPSGAVLELAEPLSPSELRVLGYMPSNLSSPEIAGELILSVNTVKTHMRHIYGKLRAHNRSEAVKIARELGLLGRSPR